MAEETVGIDSQPAHPVEGPTDDYECWRGELPEALRGGEEVLYVSGLWNPWVEQVLHPV